MNKVLVIDDDEVIRDVLQSFLLKKGFEPAIAAAGAAGMDSLRSDRYDLIITDLVMPGVNGMEVLREAMDKSSAPVIVMTAFGTVQTAVEAMRIGAFDYVTKPFNLDELGVVIEKALSVAKLRKENVMLRMQLKRKYDFKGLIGDSPAMQAVFGLIEKIANTDSTVLISGESGTGKELVAKTVHFNNSDRAQGPFVPINCAAIPKDLLESELFGHEKGAFTGAVNTRIGRFELAQGGTLFLDEVGELDPSLQAKLLRAIQEREFERVGGVRTIKIDVRILAATNKDLEKAVRDGLFREDLYYRLNVIPLHLPPLRKRIEDIPLLVDNFVHEFSKRRKRELFSFSRDAMACLLHYRWPGNVRELENLIERLSILVPGPVVNIADLPEKLHQLPLPEITDVPTAAEPQSPLPFSVKEDVPAAGRYGIAIPDAGINLNDVVDTMERNLILRALERTGGVRSKAAMLLGLNRTTLLEKMKKMAIEAPKR
jgi:nitrogen regulation protein NR(I)